MCVAFVAVIKAGATDMEMVTDLGVPNEGQELEVFASKGVPRFRWVQFERLVLVGVGAAEAWGGCLVTSAPAFVGWVSGRPGWVGNAMLVCGG